MMSNTAITLARYPDQREMLRRDPALWPDAMEELIRYESPVQGLGRTATRDVELHGVTIPEGDVGPDALRLGQPRRAGVREP